MSDMYEELFGEKPEDNGETDKTQTVNNENVNSETVSETENAVPQDKPFETAQSEYHFKGTGEKENLYGNSSQYNGYASQQSGQYGAYAQQSTPTYATEYNQNYNPYGYTAPPVKPKKEKKKKFSTGFVAFMLILCILISSALGFSGAMLYTHFKVADAEISTNGAMIINKVDIDEETAQTLSDKSTTQITEEVADTVVEITTEVMSTNSFYGQYISQGAGSGVIISSDGYIVTNNHVIDGASSITVTLRDESTYPATLVGTDSIVDVALLKIEATNLKAATFGDSDKLKVGDKAVAIGNPLGQLGGTVTDGIISALDRDVVIDDETMNLLQTDTAINPGNSGGGLFDGQGALVGVVVAKSSGEEIEGLGFAIPINDVIDILDDLKEYGYVRGRVSMGVQLIDLTNEMYSMYYYGNDEAGCYVYSVEFDSAAYKAGIQQGDRIVSVDGKAITSASEVEAALEGKNVGDVVKLELERGSKTATVELELGEYVPENDIKVQQNQNNNDIFNPFG